MAMTFPWTWETEKYQIVFYPGDDRANVYGEGGEKVGEVLVTTNEMSYRWLRLSLDQWIEQFDKNGKVLQ